MRLVHYSRQPVTVVRSTKKQDDKAFHKPFGFWVSDDACEDNWRSWCESEGYGLDSLGRVHDVVLRSDAKIIRLGSAGDIDDFHSKYHTELYPGSGLRYIDWRPVAKIAQGIIITPYIFARRLTDHAPWYYSWDCASGCIWDADAIESITLRATDAAQAA